MQRIFRRLHSQHDRVPLRTLLRLADGSWWCSFVLTDSSMTTGRLEHSSSVEMNQKWDAGCCQVLNSAVTGELYLSAPVNYTDNIPPLVRHGGKHNRPITPLLKSLFSAGMEADKTFFISSYCSTKNGFSNSRPRQGQT
jgi:hypothetical protein